MDRCHFWRIIESGGKVAIADQEVQLDSIRDALSELPANEVIGFHETLKQLRDAAYTWDLWGAAYLIKGSCSDDGFHYFRDWLIARGQEVFEAALKNPDSLAGHTDPDRDDHEFEELGYVALEVYEELTGDEVPQTRATSMTEPLGERWDFEDCAQVSQHLPRLAEIYLRD